MRRTPPDGYVSIGRLGRSFKVAGGVRLWLDSPAAAELIDEFGRLFVSGLGETRIRSHETVSGSLVVYLEGVRDRTAARALVNAEVWTDGGQLTDEARELLAEPAVEELLIGAPVMLGSEAIGSVTQAVLGSSNDFVEVRLGSGRTVLLPLVAPYVELTEEGVVLSDPPAGLLDDGA